MQKVTFIIDPSWNEQTIIETSNNTCRDWDSNTQPTQDLDLAIRRLIANRMKILGIKYLEIEKI